MQGGKAPNVNQQKWQDWQRERGCCNCGAQASIHHCVGSTAKHNKQHIGQDWTLALCYYCHQSDNGIHGDLQAFYQPWKRKEIERLLFQSDIQNYVNEHGSIPMPLEVYDAIMSYHK